MRISFFLITNFVFCLAFSLNANAQRNLARFTDAPGKIASQRLISQPQLAGYEQPVIVHVEDGGDIAHWDGAAYSSPQASQSLLGMMIGPVYQLKTSIVLRERTITVYPTIELIDRLYPPEGFANRHPIQIVLTNEDIETASKGGLVTRIIYLEDPDTALPYRLESHQQSSLDVGWGQDPMHSADRLGRPMAIVRLGSRQPSYDQVYTFPPTPLFDDNLPLQPTSTHNDGCLCPSCKTVFTCGCEELEKMPEARRDEYVCDGNDRNLPVIPTEDWTVKGLDIEDTVAHFDTEDGRIAVAPSNRVCIYAPRFASVRRTLQLNNTTITQQASFVKDKTNPHSANASERATLAKQNIQPRAHKQTQTPNAFRDQTRAIVGDNVVRLLGTRHFFKPFEDLSLIRFGKFSNSESARTSLGMQSAVAWNSDVSAQISINNSQPIIVNDVSQASELVSIETDTSSELRLCKLASLISAKPGDIVDFTIRFDNIGRKRIGNVTVLDNLSPRLEYIQDSAECSVEADFKTEPNKAGSEKLIWEIVKPLSVGDGGIIRFQCRVR